MTETISPWNITRQWWEKFTNVIGNWAYMEPLTSNVDTNGNDNASETDNDNNIEDNINEAASEDSGMSSVDNHNMSGRKMSEKCQLSAVYCQYNVT